MLTVNVSGLHHFRVLVNLLLFIFLTSDSTKEYRTLQPLTMPWSMSEASCFAKSLWTMTHPPRRPALRRAVPGSFILSLPMEPLWSFKAMRLYQLLDPQNLNAMSSNDLLQVFHHVLCYWPRAFYARSAMCIVSPENPCDSLKEVNYCAWTAASFWKKSSHSLICYHFIICSHLNTSYHG